MPHETPLRLVGISAAAEMRALIRETLATALPRARVEVAEAAPPSSSEAAPDCLVVDVSAEATDAVERVRRLRGDGYAGALVLVVQTREALLASRLAPLGALELVPRGELVDRLPEAVLAAVGGTAWGGDLETQRAALRRMQRLIAAGEGAAALQHALNNPLTALLAEAQLLEMEPLGDEHQTAVRRMIDLCRRVIALVRQLDGGAAGGAGR